MYDHQAREAVYDGRRECRVCGRPITGTGTGTRHEGEQNRKTSPLPDHSAAFADAYRIARSAAADDDTARRVVERLYWAGALRPRRAAWRHPARRAVRVG